MAAVVAGRPDELEEASKVEGRLKLGAVAVVQGAVVDARLKSVRFLNEGSVVRPGLYLQLRNSISYAASREQSFSRTRVSETEFCLQFLIFVF